MSCLFSILYINTKCGNELDINIAFTFLWCWKFNVIFYFNGIPSIFLPIITILKFNTDDWSLNSCSSDMMCYRMCYMVCDNGDRKCYRMCDNGDIKCYMMCDNGDRKCYRMCDNRDKKCYMSAITAIWGAIGCAIMTIGSAIGCAMTAIGSVIMVPLHCENLLRWKVCFKRKRKESEKQQSLL